MLGGACFQEQPSSQGLCADGDAHNAAEPQPHVGEARHPSVGTVPFVRSHSSGIGFVWILLSTMHAICLQALAGPVKLLVWTVFVMPCCYHRAWLAYEAQASECNDASSEQMKQTSEGLAAGGDADGAQETPLLAENASGQPQRPAVWLGLETEQTFASIGCCVEASRRRTCCPKPWGAVGRAGVLVCRCIDPQCCWLICRGCIGLLCCW